MSTSLAEQLKKLQVPQTSLLLQDKKRPSLLFDPKEAANLDRETVFNIGKNGLEELIKLSAVFKEFEGTLFAQSSMNLERSVLDVKLNRHLNVGVEKFLILLSPYFLLNTAHKALEWLIYRYHIHEFNKDAFLMLILPYHETRIFVRALQLVDLKNESDMWHWLEALQKPGIPLSTLTLINRIAVDHALMKLLCNHVIQATAIYDTEASSLSTLYAFYTTSVIGGIERNQRVSEIHVNCLLPALIKGLASPIIDFVAANYMILVELSRKTRLNNKTIEYLVAKALKNPIMKYELTLVICFLYNTSHNHLNAVSDKIVSRISKLKWFCKKISDLKLNQTGINVCRFIIQLIESAVKMVLMNPMGTSDEVKELLNDIFQNIPFSDNEIGEILRTTLKADLVSEELNGPGKEFLSRLYGSLEIKYPVEFDKYVKMLMESSENDINSKDTLKFLMKWHSGIESTKNSMEIFDKLNHYSPEQRILGLECLKAQSMDISDGFKELITKSMMARFDDDDVRVIRKLIDLPLKYLMQFFSVDVLIDRLMILLSQCHTDRKRVIAQPAVRLLLELCNDGDDTCVFIATLPYLFPSCQDEVEIAMLVLNSDFAKKNKYLSAAKQNIIETTNADAKLICTAAFHNILNRDLLPKTENILTTMKISHKGDATSLFFNLILLGSVCRVPVGGMAPEIALEVIEMADKMVKTYPKVKPLPNCNQLNGDKIQECLRLTSQGILPLQAATYVLEMVHRRLELKSNPILDFEGDPAKTRLVVRLIEIFFDGMSTNKKRQSHYSWCLQIFFQRHFPTCEDMVRFLSEFFINPLNAQTSLHTFNITANLLAIQSDSLQWMYEDKIFLANLLISLSRSNRQCREAAVDILKRLCIETFNLDKRGCYTLLSELSKRSLELAMDPEQLSLCLYTLLSPDPDVKMQLKKEIRLDLDKIREFLFNILLNDASTPMHVTSQLLEILAHVNGPDLLKKLSLKGLEFLSELERDPNNCKDNITHQSNDSNRYHQYNTNERNNQSMKMALKNILQRFNNTTVESLIDEKTWQFFDKSISNHQSVIQVENGSSTPSITLIKQIDSIFFENAGKVSSDLQRKIFSKFVDIVTDCEIGSIVAAVNRSVRKLEIDAQLVVNELDTMKEAKRQGLSRENEEADDASGIKGKLKKRRKSPSIYQCPGIIHTREWKRGITILEFIQKAENMKNQHFLMPVLFNLLKICINFEEQTPLEYLKQLLLSNIHYLATLNIPMSEPHLQVDLVSQCIRTSHNPQTHHHALLVLVELFKIADVDAALHNIMPIFTFMGSSVLRQDDAYSIQIISKTIETIIPIILNSSDNEIHVCEILRIFIVSFSDIPEHRRLPLFLKLLQLLKDHIHLFYLLTFECHVVGQKNIVPQDVKKSSERMEFALAISQEFSPAVLINVCIELVKFISSLPVELEDDPQNLTQNKYANNTIGGFEKKYIFDVEHNTPKQLRHYKYTVVQFLNGLLSSSDFIEKCSSMSSHEIEQIAPNYDRLIVELVLLIQSASKSANLHQGKLKGKYWRVLLHNLCESLDAVNTLLPNSTFIQIVKKLMGHDNLVIKRKSLELLNTRLQHRIFESQQDYNELSSLIESLLSIITTINNKESTTPMIMNQEIEMIQQTAVISVKLLAKILAPKEPEKFKLSLEIVIDLMKTKEGPLLGSSVICLGELCGAMRTHVIPYLSKFFPTILKLLKTRCCNEIPDIVAISIISALQKIVESVGNFLSLYLEQLLMELCRLSTLYIDSENHKISIIFAKLKIIRQKIVNCIHIRILLPATEKTYVHLLNQQRYDSIPVLMSILAESFTYITPSDLQLAVSEIATFFLRVLQFREDVTSIEDDTYIVNVEESAGKSLVSLILKLSEATFRPLYYKLYDWAARNPNKKLRTITFYRLSANIADALKSLFVLFAGHFLGHAALLLQQNNLSISNESTLTDNTLENQSQRIELTRNILNTLHKVFHYDAQNFINQERFDILAQPIIDQIENTEGSREQYDERSETLLVPCIASFAAATQDDALHKQLIYQVLLKTRHNKSYVRNTALAAIIEIARKLGQDFMPLLPETVPFLAELLEDEDEATEKTAQNAVRTLEEILGEPLQKYF